MLRFLNRPFTIVAILFATLTLTAIAWHLSSRNVTRRANERFDFRVKETQLAIHKRMLEYEQVLRGAVGLFNANDTVTRHEWKEYVATLKLKEFYPGFQGLGFTIRISKEYKEAHIEHVRKEGFPEYKIHPEFNREEFHSVIYLEPFGGRNLKAFGFDMFAEPVRREAMQRARDNNSPAASGAVTLIQETKKGVQRGFNLYLPVYYKNMPLRTRDERIKALKGFVYSPFRVKDLMRGILGEGMTDLRFRIYDNAHLAEESLIFNSHPGETEEADFTDTVNVEVAGRKWALLFESRKDFIPSRDTLQPMIIGIGGILVDVILFYILYTLSTLNRNNRILAERYKTEKDRYDIVLRSTNDVVWDWDFKKNKIRWNENLHYSLGFPLDHLDTDPSFWYDRLHPDDRERVVKEIHRVIDSNETFWSDEYRFARENGEYRHILDRGNVLHDRHGNAVRMVGSMIDITQRKKAEEKQQEFRRELERMVERRTKELERSNEDLQRFAHVASHDLKEPVRKIKTFANLIYKDYGDKLGEGKLFLEKVLSASDRLKVMIDGVLAYSTLNSSSQKIEKISLAEIISHVKNDLELLVSEKRAVIKVDDLPQIEGAEVLLYQLFYNLINNALKFSKQDAYPFVEITHRFLSNSSVEVTVKDNGIGFSQEQADKIFDTFVRLHSKDDYEGTGLGLALCKSIVNRHGGFIKAFGEKGKEARFVITLPLVQNRNVI